MPLAHQSPEVGEDSTQTLAILRRHDHDVRNLLNSIHLELQLLGELTTEEPSQECVVRLRSELAAVEVLQKSLMIKFSTPVPVVLPASDLMQLWKLQLTPLLGLNRTIDWISTPQTVRVQLDARSVVTGLAELTIASWNRSHGQPLTATLAVEDEFAEISLMEPEQHAESATGLIADLHRLAAANGGRLKHGPAAGQPSAWQTTLGFPVLPDF